MAGESVQCKIVGVKASVLDFWGVRNKEKKRSEDDKRAKET